MPTSPDERWTIDFVTDATASGRRFRVLTVVDVKTRECLALDACDWQPFQRESWRALLYPEASAAGAKA